MIEAPPLLLNGGRATVLAFIGRTYKRGNEGLRNNVKIKLLLNR